MQKKLEPVVKRELALKACDVDVFNRWKISSVLLEGQEMGEIASKEMGFSHREMTDRGNFFILSRAKINVYQYPVFEQKLIAETWTALPKRIIFPRYCVFRNDAGKVMVSISTLWMICDIKTRKLLTEEQSGGPKIPDLDYPEPLEAPGKILLPKDIVPERQLRAVRYSDLDYNGHMNNARYGDWICDLFEIERYRGKGFSEFQINFLSEMSPGDEMEMQLFEDEDHFIVEGIRQRDGQSAVRAEGHWTALEQMQG